MPARDPGFHIVLAAAHEKNGAGLAGPMEHPRVSVGTPAEHAYWSARLSAFLRDRGGEADELEQVNARLDYKDNRITLYRLADPSEERSVADTISHEVLHAVLYQMDELRAARTLDLAERRLGDPERTGGL